MNKQLRWTIAGILASSAVAVAVFGLPEVRAKADEPILMKIGTVAPDGTPWEKQLNDVKKYIERETQGKVKVKTFMGGSLGGEKQLVRRVAQNTLQAFGGSTAALGSIVPEMDIFESPYLFDDEAHADRVLDSEPVKAQVRSLLEAKGLKFALWAENGYRSWFTKEKAIRSPADFAGLRMRSQESEMHHEIYRAVGADPVPIDVTNVMQSLQTGMVDGFDNTPLFAFATSWYQSAKHLILSRHSYQAGIVIYSKRWFDGLPADVKQVLLNVPQAMVEDGRQGVRKMDPILIRNLQRFGIDVHNPSESEQAAFKSATSKVAAKVSNKIGAKGKKLLSTIVGAR
jgi:TRAP-type transport system periplasmic protein